MNQLQTHIAGFPRVTVPLRSFSQATHDASDMWLTATHFDVFWSNSMLVLRQIRFLLFPFLMVLASANVGGADLRDLTIPKDRIPIWNPGVEGGIPNTSSWAIIEANDAPYNAVGDGSTVVGPRIERALADAAAAAAAGKPTKVHLGPGDYVLGGASKLLFGPYTMLYGDGPENTRLIYYNNDDLGYSIGSSVLFGSDYAIHNHRRASALRTTQDAARGSDTVRATSSAGITVGDWILISETGKDPNRFENYNGESDDEVLTHLAKVTAVNGSRITFDRPLRVGVRTAFKAQVRRVELLEYAGIEDLALVGDERNRQEPAVAFLYAANCWLDNVQITKPYNLFITMDITARNTIQNSRLTGPSISSSVTWNYGFDLYNVHDSLFTNNILEKLYEAITVAGGASGNVISYNYVTDTRWRPGDNQLGDLMVHGGWPHENLFEGNDLQGYGRHDGYWGSNGHRNTWFRNRMDNGEGWDIDNGATGWRYAADNSAAHDDYINLILNSVNVMVTDQGFVPIDTKDNGDWDGGADNLHMWIERNIATDDSGNIGINVGPHPTTVTVGNHLGTQAPSSWNSLTFPPSLYLSSRPKWWPSSKPWPGIGADVDVHNGANVKLPAQERYEGR